MANAGFFRDNFDGFSDEEPNFCQQPLVQRVPDYQVPGPSSNGNRIPNSGVPCVTAPDPRCPQQLSMLANLFPVYVGNFRCANYANMWHRIRLYFGSKGLLAHFWFHIRDAYFEEFQSKAGLFDFLVYFGSPEDAQRAVELCNRDLFQDYPLNVLPGRDPVYFDPSRTLYFRDMKSGRIYSELFMERRIGRWGPLSCAIKFDMVTGAVEFCEIAGRVRAAKCDRLWKPVNPNGPLRKQRFLEQDLAGFIANYLRGNPGALSAPFNDDVKRMLDAGRVIKVPDFRENVYPRGNGPLPLRRGPSKKAMIGMARRKQAAYLRKCERQGIEPKQKKKKKSKKNKN